MLFNLRRWCKAVLTPDTLVPCRLRTCDIRQRRQQFWCYFVKVACTYQQNSVALTGDLTDFGQNFVPIGGKLDRLFGMTLFDGVGDQCSRDAGDGRFGSGINFGHPDTIGFLKGFPKGFPKSLRSAIAVRLKNDPKTPLKRLSAACKVTAISVGWWA